MSIPNWYELFLLAAASFRIWRLLAEDDILDWPRRKLLRLGGWQEEGDPIPPDCRLLWSKWLGCPWCSGAWISLIWWGSFQWSPHWAIVVAVPAAISAVVGTIAHALS